MDMAQYFSQSKLQDLARECGLVQRSSPITGFHFLMAFTTGKLNTPAGTLAQLAAFLSSACATHVSPQAIDERIGPAAVAFMQRCFETALRLKGMSAAADGGLLAGFDHVYLVDSTGFDLDPALRPYFKGSGGSGSAATLRIQLAMDYLTQRIYVRIGDVRLGDAPTLFQLVAGDDLDLSGRCLFLSDLGYFKLQTFEAIDANKQFFLSKLMHGVKLQAADGSPLDLMAMLKRNPPSFSMPVLINGRIYRMVGQRLSDKMVQERLRKANRSAVNKGQRKTITDAYRLFLHYAIFLTNLPASYDMDALYALYRVRWQIELVFKTWKSILNIHSIRSAKVERVMCEVYGKLILAVLTTHFAVHPEFDISRHRAMQWLKAMAMPWACAIVRGASALRAFVASQIACILRFCKKHKQRNRPTIESRLRQFEPSGAPKTSPGCGTPAIA
jgi:hypothetical protein